MADFKGSTIYQIYPKSFYDSNHDGVGDIRGVIEKLDYIQSLGVDLIWSTPFFVSPLNDNGYDVEDYRKIHPLFGTMEDVEELIREAEKRGMGIMLDMVFNHTSTRHEWFQRARRREGLYGLLYFQRWRGGYAPHKLAVEVWRFCVGICAVSEKMVSASV